VDDETVRVITEALIDDRQEVAREIPEQSAEVRLLLAQARRPEEQVQLGPALHPGALKFYEKNKPSFIQADADYIGLLITVLAIVLSWIWELRAWLERRQKGVADDYSNRAVVLMNAAREAKSPGRAGGDPGRIAGHFNRCRGRFELRPAFRGIVRFFSDDSAARTGGGAGQPVRAGDGQPLSYAATWDRTTNSIAD